MSHPKFRLVFADLAQRDIDDILAYTLENWGMEQLEKYKIMLDTAFKKIEQHPDIGMSGLLPGLRRLSAGSHVIFYRVDDTSISVIRILHGRMDYFRHLDE
ncbi:toxin ParE1/3/4 [Nitrosospira multiformis]|uniref:Toxin n=1 Tax=Nitrosospira multiformis TaxID=1231 RepID=A0A2T5IH61_9PROT|nr:type II toxin-antitoxin system RelE/ParE family toxin [Nitrosospira multiformis]PTQ83155.1 toxin ParE1/3/4 [Nitrosospira multiformis]